MQIRAIVSKRSDVFRGAALIVVAVIRQSFVSKVARGRARQENGTGTFEGRPLRIRSRWISTVSSDDHEDVRGRAAVDAIPAEALADSERVQDRGDPVGRERRYHTARLQEVPGGVPGRAPARLQNDQHHELHQAAEPLRFSQGHGLGLLQLLQPARARVPA